MTEVVIKNEIVKDYTAQFQDAIEKCSQDGGGTLIVAPGTYPTKPLELKSHVNLHLEQGATLVFSDNFNDYRPVQSRWEGVECFGYSPCLYGQDLIDVSITGKGILDGNGYKWWSEFKNRIQQRQTDPITKQDKEFDALNKGIDTRDCGGGGIGAFFFRPPLIQFNHCSNVLLEGFTARNSPFWNTHLLYCTHAVVRKVTFQNPDAGKNGDGLDIDSCKDVEIADCIFDVNDDAICLKSGIGNDGLRVNKPCENIRVKNCIVYRGHGGVVIGSETAAGIRTIKVSDCTFNGTDRGIRIKSRRGRAGVIENIEFSNIRMENVICPIVINLYYNCGAPIEQIEYLSSREIKPITATTPWVKNIVFKNITASHVHAAAAFLLGLPERPLENITFDNVNITLAQNGKSDYPAMAFGVEKMQGFGIYEEFVNNFIKRNVDVKNISNTSLAIENSI